VQIGSICGGGRYDDLTGIFGLKDVSGVGISFGADRIYDVLLALDKFPEEISNPVQLLFVNFGKTEEATCIKLAKQLRDNGISCEVYPDSAKLDKQFKYANNKKINFVAIIGDNEINESRVSIKNMFAGTQETIMMSELAGYLGK
jgi:histidyl-tRNA synthetase